MKAPDDWQATLAALTQPGDAEKALALFGPNQPDTGLVFIEAQTALNAKWHVIAGPMSANEALNATIPLHRKYERLRFTPVKH